MHAGKILVREELLVKMLGYPEGRIHYLGYSKDNVGDLAVVIEHPALPALEKGAILLEMRMSTLPSAVGGQLL